MTERSAARLPGGLLVAVPLLALFFVLVVWEPRDLVMPLPASVVGVTVGALLLSGRWPRR